MCLSGSISGRDERFCLPLAPPGQLHARAARHPWLSRALPKPPSAPRAPPQGPAGPQAEGLRDGPVTEAWEAFWGNAAMHVQSSALSIPSCGLAPSRLSPKPGRRWAYSPWQAHFRPQLAATPACVPGEARGFLRSRKLLLPSRPQRERGRRAAGFPVGVLQPAAPLDKARGPPPSLPFPRLPSPHCDRRG